MSENKGKKAVGAQIPIADAADLAKIGNDTNYPMNGDYLQTDNIDLNDLGTDWTPIGGQNSTPSLFFTGQYDGNGFTIENLNINNANINYRCYGLFGAIGDPLGDQQTELRNIKIISGTIVGGGTRANYGGAICGYNYGGLIKNCSNAASITGEPTDWIGGICGYNYGVAGGKYSAVIAACKNTGTVSGGVNTGGICGYNRGYNEDVQGQITACYNTAAVSSDVANCQVGGVCGHNEDKFATISACYNTGSVSTTGGTGTYIGGVCGWTRASVTITGCYWVGTTGPTYGIGYADDLGAGTNTGAEIFSATNWPVATDPDWGIGNDPANGEYWQSLGTQPPDYPVLWWE